LVPSLATVSINQVSAGILRFLASSIEHECEEGDNHDYLGGACLVRI
jgi:hypothetical protein